MIGYVYKIVHSSNPSVVPYIGSTTQRLSKRMTWHRADYKKWKNGKYNKVSVFDNFEAYGITNFRIIEIARYEVLDSQELRKHEQSWMDKMICCNKSFAYGRDLKKKRECKRKLGAECDKRIIESLRFYCHDCDHTFPRKGFLNIHFNSKNHLQNTLPIGL